MLLTVGIVAWVLLAVFVCALGRAAKTGDRIELECLARSTSAGTGEPASSAGIGNPLGARPTPVTMRGDPLLLELFDARRALGTLEARLARLEKRQR